jgi:hypothetical protein
MTLNVSNVDPFLRTSWHFTNDLQALTVELTRSFNEVAIVTNMRTIGHYPTNLPAFCGDLWYLNGANRQQQPLRQVYPFSDSNLTIKHNINFNGVTNFVKIYGTFLDGSGNWCPLPYVDVTAANNQINVSVNSSTIVITKGAGSPPACNNGLIVLEWLSNS